jgi:hypothetical protein
LPGDKKGHVEWGRIVFLAKGCKRGFAIRDVDGAGISFTACCPDLRGKLFESPGAASPQRELYARSSKAQGKLPSQIARGTCQKDPLWC